MKATIKLTKRQKYNCSNWRFKARYSTLILFCTTVLNLHVYFYSIVNIIKEIKGDIKNQP